MKDCIICIGSCRAIPSQRTRHVRETLSHGCDGPLTPFVLICRAINIALDMETDSQDVIANALHEELAQNGWIVDEADVVLLDTGS